MHGASCMGSIDRTSRERYPLLGVSLFFVNQGWLYRFTGHRPASLGEERGGASTGSLAQLLLAQSVGRLNLRMRKNTDSNSHGSSASQQDLFDNDRSTAPLRKSVASAPMRDQDSRRETAIRRITVFLSRRKTVRLVQCYVCLVVDTYKLV